MVIDKINTDLKSAMLSGDKQLTGVLRDLKSALLYEQVSQGSKGSEPSDELITKTFNKELKKRKDAILLYEKADDNSRIEKEQYECEVISRYLPEPVSEDDIKKAISKAVSENKIDISSSSAMGQIIGGAKANLSGTIDGAQLAKLVREFMVENS
ncbi:MAG: GatB/YqeY domain-containing protein [Patescibacteria group bacterium]